MSVPKGFPPFRLAYKLLLTYLNQLTRRSYASSRESLGMVNFYHRFIPHCAGKLHPLPKLLSSTEFIWSSECEEAFHFCKSALANATLLVHPKCNAPTSTTFDASDLAAGAVLGNLSTMSGAPSPSFLASYSRQKHVTVPLTENC